MTQTVGVGTAEFAAALLGDLYITLRRNLQRWASVTHQTPQARMGYVGQHLVSVVTGFPGGRSGARGDDLKLPDGKVGEIKCCYRVDQLGKCKRCGAAVASIETLCPNQICKAKADEIVRGDDSKWLLGPKDEKELRELFIPSLYYFVLFEFVDLAKAEDINVQIFEVDPKGLGFALCMIDYFFMIRPKSSSKAPFNLWPASPKFFMMKPKMIYHAVIRAADTVDTILFPGKNPAKLETFGDLASYYRADTIDEAVIDKLAVRHNVRFDSAKMPKKDGERRKTKLTILQEQRVGQSWKDEDLADDFARAVFRDRLQSVPNWLKEYAPTL